MATQIEDLRRFSIHDLKRLGMLHDGFKCSLEWKQNGEKVANIGLSIYLTGSTSVMLLNYNIAHSGEVVQDLVEIRRQKSNLPGHTGGYWMFVCPVTDKPCRVLYLHDGHFKSRQALPKGTLYKCQRDSPYLRNMGRIFDYSDRMATLDGTLYKPYGKTSYRGKPTRKTKRLLMVEERYERVMFQWLQAFGWK